VTTHSALALTDAQEELLLLVDQEAARAGGGKSLMDTVSLTDLGRSVASERALVDLKGALAEFCEGLSPLQLRVLDVVAERETRAAGSAFTRSQARTAVRNLQDATETLEEVNEVISSLAGRYLEVGLGGVRK